MEKKEPVTNTDVVEITRIDTLLRVKMFAGIISGIAIFLSACGKKCGKMKPKKSMRALNLLMVIVLVGAIFVPVVSAENQTLDQKETHTLIVSIESKISDDILEINAGNQHVDHS